MNNLSKLIMQFKEIADNPGDYVKDYLNKTSSKAIGYFYYAPQELIHAAGMLPVGVWGGTIELSAVRRYFPTFICSVLQTSLELGIQGAFDYLSGVIIPANCDSLRTMGQNWKAAVPQVEFISLVQPVNRKTEAGVKFLVTEYEEVKSTLERISGKVINDEELSNGIEIFNNYRQTMREFTKIAQDYPEIITPSVRHAVIKSGGYMDKAIHTKLVAELIAELRLNPVKKWTGTKVIVTGIKLDSPQLLNILEENEVAFADDDLAQETRQFRTDVLHTGSNPLESLARYWSAMEGCSLLYDPDKKRGDTIVEAVKETGADGVLFCMTKFCDPEEFDYAIFKKQLESANIPHVYIETDLEMDYDEQARTRIQAFVEIINS